MPITAYCKLQFTLCMIPSASTSGFLQWLLTGPIIKPQTCAITVHCDDSLPYAQLIQSIADYLNEYDDEGDGRWLPACPELVRKISQDANHRRLLGMPALTLNGRCDPLDEDRSTLTCLGQRGHVVLRAPKSSPHDLQFANSFHVAVGTGRKIPETCHLFLNSGLMDLKCIAHVIGDVFLEWLHCDLRRGKLLHEIR